MLFPILAISTLMGQMVPVVGVQGRHGGTAPRIGHPCLQLSKETGSRKCLLFLSSPFISQVGKGKKKALAQVTWSDSGKAVFASQVPRPQTGAPSPMRYLFLPHLTPFPCLVARG